MESTITTAPTGESKGTSGVYVYCIIECGEARTFGKIGIGGGNGHVQRHSQIKAEVDLFINLVTFVDVAALIGKRRFHSGIGERQKRARPQKPVGSLEPEVRKRLIVLAAHFAVEIAQLYKKEPFS